MSVTARMSGRCHGCGEDIVPGDAIDRESGGTRWVHADCVNTDAVDRADPLDFDQNAVCQSCFTVRAVNGACACPA